MRKLLLLFPLIFGLTTVNAQYTITDEGGDPIADGATINIELPNSETNSEVHWHLHSSTADDIVFQVTGTTQPAGAHNLFCVGDHCYAPNFSNPATEPVDASNEALLILYYKPRGTTAPAVVDYTIHKSGDPSVNISFSISYTIATDIEELTKKEGLVAYPNPANSSVNISYNTFESGEIILYNIVGEQVRKYSINAGSQELKIQTSDLPSGTYFYSMITDSKVTETKRLVIKH